MFSFSHAQTELRQIITDAYARSEPEAVKNLIDMVELSGDQRTAAAALSKSLMTEIRKNRHKQGGVDALMQEFSLSSEEGVALMCLAEALLRVPDKATRDKLIKDKLSGGNWKSHLHNSRSLFVNAAAWGLLVTGKLVDNNSEKNLSMALTRVMSKGGQPLIRKGVDYAMRILGKQFVTGENIEKALANGKEREKKGYVFSFDMLGEAAMTQEDADRYYQDYVTALHAIGKDSQGKGIYQGNGLSIKLSAIHPRYWRAQHERVMNELLPRVKELCLLAKNYNLGLNIDAEEASRLEISLDLMEALVGDPDLVGFDGIGFVVQAYQKRAPYVLDFLIDLARRNNQKLMIRLVKGAYWDSEIKWAQVDGFDGYPVYTRKVHTDISYLACAKKLLSAQDVIYPQFATHNAYSLAAIYQMGQGKEFEFQCLHGMGETLYDLVVGDDKLKRQCRIYAPVGSHETLLAYLVRRLLENGANSSFVNQILDDKISIDDLVKCPLDEFSKTQGRMHKAIPLPADLYENRRNSQGVNLNNENTLIQLERNLNIEAELNYAATSLTANPVESEVLHNVYNPANHADIVGQVQFMALNSVAGVVSDAINAQEKWQQAGVSARAKYLRKFADLLEQNSAKFIMLAVREAGKTYTNAVAEIREAVDFCNYYSQQAEALAQDDQLSPALGTVVTISPWNFPLAIFIGELSSSLIAGNSVIAKPAEQTSLIAHEAVKLLHQAGVDKAVAQLVLGAGEVGAALTQDERINGVIFTGSTEVAKLINKNLAQRSDNPVLIAETGGQNAMIVDSTALAEQVCVDVLNSAFDSAGQRCSALRVLCLQEEIADHMINMIKGAMNELKVGDPKFLNTDIGPVIDVDAKQNLEAHIEKVKKVAKSYHQIELSLKDQQQGNFIAPILFELNNLDELTREVFGPVLHIIRYKASELDQLIDQINSKGYALTHGIHSRIESSVEHIKNRIQAGNIYINRNIVGAVVGVQPFGGHGLSGTGPKAGGCFYLQRLINSEQWLLPTIISQNGKKSVAAKQHLNTVENMLNGMGFNTVERKKLAAVIGESLISGLSQLEIELQGPTGELNTIYWHAPQAVYLVDGDLATSFAHFIKLAFSGIKTAVTSDHPLALWSEHANSMIEIVSEQQALNYSHWIVSQPASVELKIKLASLEGKIIQLIDASKGLDIARVFHEISCSNNTTASGGNANLMVASEN